MSRPQDRPSAPRPVAARAAQIILVSSVMLGFISYWRVAAVVLCDMASTAYYIGGIVEQSIGPAAPWFILAVMCFSYPVRSVYIESSALFIRGGVYRVVKEALGGFLAKLSVSALMFDYVLTGPISAVSAGQYVLGLILELYTQTTGVQLDAATKDAWKAWGSVAVACLITLYFFRQNLLGIHESSGKALKIMIATTVIAVIMFVWCGVTLAVQGPKNSIPVTPTLAPKLNPATNQVEPVLGFLTDTSLGDRLTHLQGSDWFSAIGLIGILIAFGHSILAMSGEETLAQVYREVEAPKLPNFRKAALIVFFYCLVLTGGISFLAVLLIPNDVRMTEYADNLIGGLAMYMAGPVPARLLLNGLVVVVGSLILAGAVNTAIIGSNGVLNRVAEDGVLPSWFRKPHERHGTTHRILYLILGLQLFTILVSRGDTLLLGEAYAFGVVWSFVFKALAMLVLRFRDPRPREYKVPLNVKVGRWELPIGLGLIFVALLTAAVMNLLTKEVATKWGLGFTAAFLSVFLLSEYVNQRKRRSASPEHLERFNQRVIPQADQATLNLTKPYRMLIAIRSPQNLHMLEKALAGTDPETTEVVVMTAKVLASGLDVSLEDDLDSYDQRLMTAVVEKAESVGKPVVPLIIPTNNALHAVLRLAHDLRVQEVVLGASNKFTAEEQLDQTSFYWVQVTAGVRPAPGVTVRLLARDRDVTFDLLGGNRIPRLGERRARSVAELRASGLGVDRVMYLHDGSRQSSDSLLAVLTMLDEEVELDLVQVPRDGANGPDTFRKDLRLLEQLNRQGEEHTALREPVEEVVAMAKRFRSDLILVPETSTERLEWVTRLIKEAPCSVGVLAAPRVPEEPATE